MTNTTRQGSVLSPTIWAIYVEELISKLRKQGIGYTMSGFFVGVVVFADDVALISPNRTAMQQCTEVQLVANIVARNVATCTGRNLKLMSDELSVNPWLVCEKFPACEVPAEQEWVLPELAAALEERLEGEGEGEEMDLLDFVINSVATI